MIKYICARDQIKKKKADSHSQQRTNDKIFEKKEEQKKTVDKIFLK